jgi:general stress protein CsbA
MLYDEYQNGAIRGENVEGQILLAMFVPGLLVLLFARITYNEVIGLALTVALIAASVYKGYTHTWLLMIIDSASLTAGFWLSNHWKKNQKKSA